MIKKQPISAVQNKLYKHLKWYPEDPSYNLAFLFRFPTTLDSECICEAIEQVLNAQEAFKVNFAEQNHEIVMVYDSKRQVKVHRSDIRYMPVEEQNTFAKSFADKKFSEVIDVSQWPLCHIHLFTGTDNYFLFILVHHIISDVFTAYQFFEKTSRQYNYMKGYGEKLPDIEGKSYFDAINHMTSQNRQVQAESYFEQVASECKLIESHFPVRKPTIEVLKGDTATFLINDKRIREYAKANNISIYNFFVLAYSVFIMKINRDSKTKIGIPLANRDKSCKDAFGYFVNVLPLTISFDTVEMAQKEITKKIFQLLRYQSYDAFISPDSELLNIDNVITYYKEALAFSLAETTCTPIPLTAKHIKYPLSMTIENIETDNYRITIEYSDYFSQIPWESTITNIINQLLEGKQTLETIHLLSDNDKKDIWHTLNHQQPVKRALGGDIVSVLNNSFKEFPDAIALEDSDSTWTYSQLNEYSDKISAFLSGRPEQNIVVSVPRSKELIGLLVGILKAGKTYIPVDTTIPYSRKDTILSQLENTLILADEKIIYQYAHFGHEVIDYTKLEIINNEQIGHTALPSEIAYIIFTSGSTGIPKGVMVSHRNILQYFEALYNEYEFSENDTWTLFHSPGFDYSIMEIFGALLFGGKLLIIPQEICLVPNDFYSYIIDHKATVLTQTPTYLVNLINEDLKTEHCFGHVKYIFSAAEAAHFSLFKPFFDKYQNKDFPKLCNAYGVTEATIISTFHPMTMEDILLGADNIIGSPYSNINCFVGDYNADLMPVGIPGELIIAGESVTKGYYKNEKETKRAFQRINDENLNLSDTPVYHTGDLVVMLSDGELKYLDRIDNQVQIRGFRVELGEIETAVMQFDNIKECIAVYREFTENDMRLIAYIIKENPNIQVSRDEILTYLKKKLPYYMVPSFIVEITEKPLTVNGKVDKEKLPLPSDQTEEDQENSEVYDSITSTLIDVWKDVLNNRKISINDNFFDMGGTSIHLPKLYYKILDVFKLDEKELCMIDMFEFTTVELLAEYIKALKIGREMDNV